jgi:hypothetical protein
VPWLVDEIQQSIDYEFKQFHACLEKLRIHLCDWIAQQSQINGEAFQRDICLQLFDLVISIYCKLSLLHRCLFVCMGPSTC